MNFCTSSARFAPTFVRQPNGSECTQMVRNAPKRQFRVQWSGSGAFVVKIPSRLRGTNFCTSSARFATRFVRQQNGPRCTQMVRNAPKRHFRDKWGGSSAFVAKNFDATSWHEHCTSSARFPMSFVRQPNGPRMCPNGKKCTKMLI